jgi:hypothetical protein
VFFAVVADGFLSSLPTRIKKKKGIAMGIMKMKMKMR